MLYLFGTTNFLVGCMGGVRLLMRRIFTINGIIFIDMVTKSQTK
jgi:hypothetical protein